MKNWPWKYFQPIEVLSPAGMEQLVKGTLMIQNHFMDKLEKFRTFVDWPMIINHGGHNRRGYRSPEENAKIANSSPFSFHMQGLAADISVRDIPLAKLKELAIEFGWHGVGYYPNANFIHVDLRPRLVNRTAIWEGQTMGIFIMRVALRVQSGKTGRLIKSKLGILSLR